ncbi:MAG TPA: AIR synthase-related protein, partial [Bacteroidia bacterium]|nr:AIR synthase-related protein [Bacteroidia bacterium]
IGKSRDDIASSEYLYSYLGVKNSPAPSFDLDEEYEMQQLIKALIKNNLIESAHDVSDGGLFITLLESAMPRSIGFDISADEDIRKDAFLFGESQSRVVVSISPEKLDAFVDFIAGSDVEFTNLGEVTPGEIKIDGENFEAVMHFKNVYDGAIGKVMEGF